MLLTELKEKIDDALKLHQDYEVKVNETEIDECGIDSSRFNFNIFVDDQIFNCDEYHIEEDDSIILCDKCNIYYPNDNECPGCELNQIKKNNDLS